ncbi:MAG: relaxase/mobilization nuclease domain-containing protein [Pseudomonadota bacterium]
MILKASQRGGGMQLAAHLVKLDDNEHVEVHQIRGFVSDTLHGAMKEAYAVSRGTKCRQHLFSLSLSPPMEETVSVATFEKAIDDIEDSLGLSGQPRMIVFHEKHGRRHAHCVWSRIKADTMKAVKLSYTKLKLREHSRRLYLENGWKMPRGLTNSAERNPLNYDRAEYEQAKRAGRNPKAIKEIFQDCWAISDGVNAFQNALEARGFYLARGDRRGFVAVDWQGEIYAVAKWAGVRTKEVKAKLGDPWDQPSVASVQSTLVDKIHAKHKRFAQEVRQEFRAAQLGLEAKRQKMVAAHRAERAVFEQARSARWEKEARARAARFRKGIAGLWDRITGRHTAIRGQNEAEIIEAKHRDDAALHPILSRHGEEIRDLHDQSLAQHERFENELLAYDTKFKDQVARQEAEELEEMTQPRISEWPYHRRASNERCLGH